MKTRTAILSIVLGLAAMPAVRAQEGKDHDHEQAKGHSHEMSEIHGGSVTMTPRHHFEAVFTPEAVRLYGYDAEQEPINVMKDVEVEVTLQKKSGDSEDLTMSYVGPDEAAGRSQGYFSTPYDFGDVKEGRMKATFLIAGLAEEPITFKTGVSVSEPVIYACPMHPDVTGEDPIACSKCGMAMTRQGHDHDDEDGMKEQGHEGHDH